MTRERLALEPSWLLRTQPYRDTSLLLEAFSAERGRFGLVARGVRGPRSRQRALLQPLRPLLLSASLSGELGTLTGVEADGPVPSLRGDAQICGWYLNELLLRLLQRHDPQPAVHAHYAAAVHGLSLRPDTPARTLRRFEKALLDELGYGLWLPADLEPQRCYRYLPDDGPQPTDDRDPRGLVGASLIALRDDTLGDDARQLRDARRLLQAALRPLLGDRPLQTQRLWASLHGLRGTDAASSLQSDEPPPDPSR